MTMPRSRTNGRLPALVPALLTLGMLAAGVIPGSTAPDPLRYAGTGGGAKIVDETWNAVPQDATAVTLQVAIDPLPER
ncbi:hypothetical protein [Kribbella sp. NPDC048915]|uniref:hypothetical protein n=1 Tax=Kribbella sp. NPDC048915 TaxID=3155148 RepID=UPI0033D6F110